ncbi:Fe-S cluster assembly protein SufD [Thermoplasma sp.]|uniref:Fe-S cluster assembly protein SufD n=1 Tax=Thermoplasma sp. TaxID=1973142 RepID=UPI00260BCE9B|nr:Fe-S cluster assembly protein SufD [Thermoplasma sp.]
MIEQIRDMINERGYDRLHEYRQENFIQFMKTPPQIWKESPTRMRYVEFADDYVEKMVLGRQEEGNGDYRKGSEDVAIVNGHVYVYNDRGIIVSSMREAEEKHASILYDYAGKEYVYDRYEFLINAGFHDGLFIYVPKGMSVSIDIEDYASSTSSFAEKNMIVADEGSHLKIFRRISGSGTGNGYQGDNTYIFLGKNSTIEYNQVQDRPKTVIGLQFIRTFMDDYSSARIYHAENGYDRSIIVTESYQYGNGTNYQVRGVSFTRSLQQMDLRDNTIQIGTHTVADIYIRGIVRDRSLTMQRGNIDIREMARHAEGYYDTRILLLSKEAFANTKPALLINNNDVRSKHASAISNIDDQSLFYLRSRGIDEETAKNMIVEGFTEHVVEGSDERIKEAVVRFSGL